MTTLRRAVAMIALLGLSQLSWAGSAFGLSPLRLNLSAKAPMGAFTLINSGDVPVVVQAQPMAWRQADGRDVHEPTRALLVNPAIVSLAPGERQVVRVALRAAPDRESETGYRLLFTEVPQASDNPASAGMNVRLIKRMDVPIFAAPAKGEPKAVGSIVAESTGGVLGISFSNAGTGHWRVGDLRIHDAATGTMLAPPALVSVLPGAMRRLEVPLGDRQVPERLTLEANVDGEPFRAELAVDRR